MLSDYQSSLERRRQSAQTVRLRLFWIRKFGERVDLADARLEDMERWIAEREADWSESTVATVIASLHGFYRWAAATNRIPVDPSLDLVQIRVHRTPSRITPDVVIREALGQAGLADEAMLLLGAECGMRVSEIAALMPADRDGEWLTIIGKGNQQRSLWVSERLGRVLDELERTHVRWGYYFPGRSGGHLHPTTVWKHIRNLTGMNPHALRHRAGTTVYRNTGRDLRATQEFLGHKRPETTAIYVHVEREDLRRAGQAAAIAA